MGNKISRKITADNPALLPLNLSNKPEIDLT